MKNKTEKTEITIYKSGFFGITKIEGTLVNVGRKDYAQYKNVPFVHYIPKGKRKPTGYLITSCPYDFVIIGGGYPDTLNPLTEKKDEGAFVTCQSRYASFDERYKTEFDEVLNGLKTAHPEKIILDIRDTVKTNEVNFTNPLIKL